MCARWLALVQIPLNLFWFRVSHFWTERAFFMALLLVQVEFGDTDYILSLVPRLTQDGRCWEVTNVNRAMENTSEIKQTWFPLWGSRGATVRTQKPWDEPFFIYSSPVWSWRSPFLFSPAALWGLTQNQRSTSWNTSTCQALLRLES